MGTSHSWAIPTNPEAPSACRATLVKCSFTSPLGVSSDPAVLPQSALRGHLGQAVSIPVPVEKHPVTGAQGSATAHLAGQDTTVPKVSTGSRANTQGLWCRGRDLGVDLLLPFTKINFKNTQCSQNHLCGKLEKIAAFNGES